MTTTYDYKVRDQSGVLVKGTIEAENVPTVAGRLRQMGYLPVEIKIASNLALRREIKLPGLGERVRLKEVAVMSRQLATMIAAGLTLVRALSVLVDQLQSKLLRETLEQIRTEVERGSGFSSALERHPKVFNRLYVAMIKAGEASGQLDLVLLKLADQLEKQVELRRKVRSAFTYPVVVVCVVVLVVTAMMLFVVPTFKHLYSSLNGTLPLPTRMVIAVSNTVASVKLVFVIAAVAAAVVGVRRAIATERGRELWDRLKLKPPIFGPLAHKVALSQFTNTLSSLLLSGLGIIEALTIAADNVGSSIVANAARAVRSDVREGKRLGASLAEHPVMPAMVTQMIATGEESGAVGDMLGNVATFYDNEVEATVSSLTSILEPVLIVFMGICIGFIVVSLYLPMFNYIKLLQNPNG